MTDLPYTDDDLRDEAATQHATLTEDPDYMGVGERMEDSLIPSCMGEATGPAWGDLLDEDQYDAAQRKIHDLIRKAADVSDWAISLGADGLEPDEHKIGFNAGDKPIVRIHFAFAPDLSDEAREALVVGLGEAAARELGLG